MTDIIKLLPDSVANQIAAGEVIQRPASVIKELVENALDAGADKIDIVVKDAGRTLVSVIDNGCGMSDTDARLCFERHATSKIKTADDLFKLRTMGFRGEALASIAAVAQVELMTKRGTDEIGTKIVIEGSVVKEQTIKPMAKGTHIHVKNLFFNVPARRNFLKSNEVEMRHVVEEFTRIAIINPEVSFTLTSNDKELFHLYGGTLKQRIVGLFGKEYDGRLLPVGQETNSVVISGFIVKPEFSKKTRGEQYFFANKRFIKHSYLHHAVENAFQELLPKDSFPGYFIDIEVDPKNIDVNIHPTKTEVNFIDVKLVYAILHAAVRKAIGQHNLAPLLDFSVDTDVNAAFDQASMMDRPITQPHVDFNPSYNPFRNATPKPNGDNWRILYESDDAIVENPGNQSGNENDNLQTMASSEQDGLYLQLQQSFIVTAMRSGLMVIDQHLAHERILFDKFLKQIENHAVPSQQELFPHNISLSAGDASLLKEIRPELEQIGFTIEPMGLTTFVVKGTPSDLKETDILSVVENILETCKNGADAKMGKAFSIARAMASQSAVKSGQRLTVMEMRDMVDKLFACSVPETAPNGKKIFTILNVNELKDKLAQS